MTFTVWQFLFYANRLFQGNVKFQLAAIRKCDISISEICIITLRAWDILNFIGCKVCCFQSYGL
jgi:hypothetical protein